MCVRDLDLFKKEAQCWWVHPDTNKLDQEILVTLPACRLEPAGPVKPPLADRKLMESLHKTALKVCIFLVTFGYFADKNLGL